jgi:WD40 repeat protein
MTALRRILAAGFKHRYLVGGAALMIAASILIRPWPHDAGSPVTIADEPALSSPTPAPSPTEQSATPSPSETPSPEAGSTTAEHQFLYEHASLSRNASVVAFTIRDLTERSDPVADVFVRSRATHRTSRISVSVDGGASNGPSDNPVVSADGTRVAFVSQASDLVAGDTNSTADVFVRDLISHRTTRVSVSSTGEQGNGSSGSTLGDQWTFGWGIPSISADGRYVAFESRASNLVANDSNGAADVFVHDLETGATVALSIGADGRTGNAASHFPSISADGRHVAFDSEATDLTLDARPAKTISGVFVHDVARGTTDLVSVSSSGEWLPEWNGSPSISGAGDVVAFINIPSVFDSPENAIDEGGDVLRRDLAAGTTTHSDVHNQPGNMKRVALSGDGDVTAFVHLIGGMDAFCYLLPPENRGGYLGACDRTSLAVSPDGRYVAFGASLDALGDPDDEKRFGGDLGAMIYDRVTDEFTAAWKL